MQKPFVVQAPTHTEAFNKVKDLFGTEAVIRSCKYVRRGGFLGFFGHNEVEISGFQNSSIDNEKKQLAKNRIEILSKNSPVNSFNEIKKEISILRESLEGRELNFSGQNHGGRGHPILVSIEQLLENNDFSTEYRQFLISSIKDNFSINSLENELEIHQFIAKIIGSHLSIRDPIEEFERTANSGPSILVLVGPTGVGKTTTIAKLAAMYGICSDEGSTRGVHLATMDNYRIGAWDQIEKYGEILRMPVTPIESVQDFKKITDTGDNRDIILVDTIGRSPVDFGPLAEMRSILETAGKKSETQLVVSATTKYQDLDAIFREFEPFKYDSIIVTKLDETATIGNIASALRSRQKRLSYICTGQNVPQDIERASIINLLLKLDGFRLNRKELELEFKNFESTTILSEKVSDITGVNSG